MPVTRLPVVADHGLESYAMERIPRIPAGFMEGTHATCTIAMHSRRACKPLADNKGVA